ncbi:hypothetical protein Tco_0005760 [Tanacetum coccineum]
MVERTKLDEDLSGIPVDQTQYRNINLSSTKKHIEAVKRVFRYLQGTINMGLWYSKDTTMALTGYEDVDLRWSRHSKKHIWQCSVPW